MLKLAYTSADPDLGPEMPHITVDAGEYGTVDLTLECHPKETLNDMDVDRNLTPDEARALAAALIHFADAADRSR